MALLLRWPRGAGRGGAYRTGIARRAAGGEAAGEAPWGPAIVRSGGSSARPVGARRRSCTATRRRNTAAPSGAAGPAVPRPAGAPVSARTALTRSR